SFNTPMQNIDANDFVVTINGQRLQLGAVTPIYDSSTYSTEIRASVAVNTPIDSGSYVDVIYVDTNGNNLYDPGELVLYTLQDSGYTYNTSILVDLNNVTNLTVQLVHDQWSPAQDFNGRHANFGKEFRLK